ncbi:MAG: rod shape-determining protein RodA [Candidatus Kapabacteria bacterium]|nr:rod shape-determining protein RodA [Candidatus Kapabacteria bacterium]
MGQERETGIYLKRNPGEFFDWRTFLTTVTLTAIGLISIYSATFDAGMSSIFTRQLYYSIIGLALMVGITFIPERWITNIVYILFGTNILLLIAVLIIGKEINGTKGWLSFGSFNLQPAEFAKLSTLLLLAKFISTRGFDVHTVRDLGKLLLIFVVPVTLIFLQPDHGTTTVFLALFIGILFWAGFDLFIIFILVATPLVVIFSLFGIGYFVLSLSIFAIIAALFRRKIWVTVLGIIIVGVAGYLSNIIVEKLEPYQKERIAIFLDPGSHPKKQGYNVIQSILAVGNGGLTGAGFLQGTQTRLKYIPEQWTDFIFSVPTEEFGFLGGLLVIGLLAFLINRSMRIAAASDSKFLSIVSFGGGVIILYHSIINIGMAIGIVPVMGIPLPFLSSGGSFLITNFCLVGLMLNAYRTQKLKKIV